MPPEFYDRSFFLKLLKATIPDQVFIGWFMPPAVYALLNVFTNFFRQFFAKKQVDHLPVSDFIFEGQKLLDISINPVLISFLGFNFDYCPIVIHSSRAMN